MPNADASSSPAGQEVAALDSGDDADAKSAPAGGVAPSEQESSAIEGLLGLSELGEPLVGETPNRFRKGDVRCGIKLVSRLLEVFGDVFYSGCGCSGVINGTCRAAYIYICIA